MWISLGHWVKCACEFKILIFRFYLDRFESCNFSFFPPRTNKRTSSVAVASRHEFISRFFYHPQLIGGENISEVEQWIREGKQAQSIKMAFAGLKKQINKANQVRFNKKKFIKNAFLLKMGQGDVKTGWKFSLDGNGNEVKAKVKTRSIYNFHFNAFCEMPDRVDSTTKLILVSFEFPPESIRQ